MTPPYHHQTTNAEGIYEHYKSVAKNHTLGLIVYKTSLAILDIELFKRLADIENIIGIKDASGDYNFAREICIKLGDRFIIISGGSIRYYLWHWLWGAPAYITSIANLVPQIEIDFFNYLKGGDLESGLWANLSHIKEDKWVNDVDRPLWGGDAERLAATTENMAHNFNVLRFGAPCVTRLSDGTIFVAFWCVEDCVSNIRWFRLQIH